MSADLTLSVAGADLRVRASGDLVVVTAPSVPDAFALLRAARSSPTAPRALTEWLARSDLTVVVRARDRTLATLGAGVEPGVLSRLAGLGPAAFYPVGALAALLTRPREA